MMSGIRRPRPGNGFGPGDIRRALHRGPGSSPLGRAGPLKAVARRTPKFWLEPVDLERSVGYKSIELAEIRKLIQENILFLKARWDAHFGS